MSIKKKLRNPFVQQYIIEIVFPLMGYFFFDWSLAIIAVFYLMDQLSSEIMFFRRLHRIKREGENNKGNGVLLTSVFSFLLLFSVQIYLMLLFWIDIYKDSIDTVANEIINFGKDEAWILFPVILFLYHFKDQFTFYMPRRYLYYDLKKSFIYRLINTIILILLIITGMTIWQYSGMNEVAVLLTFVVLKIAFDFTVGKWVKKKSLIN